MQRVALADLLKGNLFATVASFAAQGLIRVASSMLLTRLLQPSAYGVITVLVSVSFTLAMLSDIGISVCIVRDEQGEEPRFINTAWTLRVIRSSTNALILLAGAGVFARLYAAPDLTAPLRVLSLWFVVDGFESTAFPIAIRRRNARIVMYCELLAGVLSTVFSVVYCYFSRDYWGMVYGMVVNRLLLVLMSHCFYRELRPRLQLDRAAAMRIFGYTRYVMPSSILTLLLTQFDKVIFLRLFNLALLGVYGLAGSIAAPIEGLILKASQSVLYPRCAHNFRENPATYAQKYYAENVKLFVGALALPALIGGGARLLIALLYDPRYAQAAQVLQAFMLRAGLLALASPAEDMLIASGETRVILIGNLFRATWLVVACLIGYWLFGFIGFIYGMASSGLPPLLYYLWLQNRKGMLIGRFELYRVTFACVVAVVAYACSSLILATVNLTRIRF